MHHLSFLMLLLESDNNVLGSAAECALDLRICLISVVNFFKWCVDRKKRGMADGSVAWHTFVKKEN